MREIMLILGFLIILPGCMGLFDEPKDPEVDATGVELFDEPE